MSFGSQKYIADVVILEIVKIESKMELKIGNILSYLDFYNLFLLVNKLSVMFFNLNR